VSWQDRVRGEIKLTSPEGNVFIALWIGNERTKEKRIAFFNYPKVDGTFSQDLGVNGTKYPLVILFEGEDNDIIAAKFFDACSQKGFWLVIHPVLGALSLRLVSVTQPIQPVTNGNISEISIDMVETIDVDALVSSPELIGAVGAGIETLNNNTAKGFLDRLKAGTAAARAAVTIAANKAVRLVDIILSPLVETISEIQSLFDATQTAIQITLAAVVLEPLSLAAQFKTLIQTPALAIRDTKSRLDYYNKVKEDIFDIENESILPDGQSTTQIKEMLLMSVVAASANSIITGDISTRTQAISAMESINEMFTDIVNHLDALQSRFIDNDIDAQYFSQTSNYSDSAELVAMSLRYLSSSISALKIEKIIRVEEPTAPIQIALTEYGGPGKNDENIDYFIATNNLKGNEILLLQPGREVKVYV